MVEATLKSRARGRYERARLRAAAITASPLAVIVALAWLVERSTMPIAIAGPLLVLTGFFLFWRGGDLARGVLPGVAAGTLPFLAMNVARVSGHVCRGAFCFSTCLPATLVGATLAGLFIGQRARHSHARLAAWSSAGLVAVLTGALGCACVGVGGIVGLVAGIVLGSLPLVVVPSPARGRS